MTPGSPVADARDAALDALRGCVTGMVRTAAVVAGPLGPLHDPAIPVSVAVEAIGPVPILRIGVTADCPALTRAGYVAAAGALGVDTLILVGAGVPTGVLREHVGLVAVEDHINLTGGSPLIGRHDPLLGPRFPDMSAPYSLRLLESARRYGTYPGCIYAGCTGAQLRMPGYREWLGSLGADLAGPWIVPELLAARQGSMQVLAFAVPVGAHSLTATLPAGETGPVWDRIKGAIVRAVADSHGAGGRVSE